MATKKNAIKTAFQKLNATEQAQVLGELAATLAHSLSEMDRLDAKVFRERKSEEATARPLAEVKKRLHKAVRRSA